VKNIGKHNKVHLEVGFQTAICVNNTTVKSWLNNQPIKTSVNPLFGIVVGFDVAHSFKLYTGINYFKRELIGKDSIRRASFSSFTGWVYRVDKPFDIATEFLEIPIALHYEFNKKNPKYIPKFILGVAIMTPLRTTKYQEYFDALGRYVDATYGLYKRGLINPSLFIGGGVRKNLKNKSSADVNLKFVYGSDDPTQEGRFYNKRLELSINYLFALGRK
jgi:Outer membrane protein beta-barrel domain